jgi:hypothetical protein
MADLDIVKLIIDLIYKNFIIQFFKVIFVP